MVGHMKAVHRQSVLLSAVIRKKKTGGVPGPGATQDQHRNRKGDSQDHRGTPTAAERKQTKRGATRKDPLGTPPLGTRTMRQRQTAETDQAGNLQERPKEAKGS